MNRVILITGTSKGIGRQLCEYYLAQGDTVAGCSRSDSSFNHPAYLHFTLDVSDEKAVKQMVRQVKTTYGKIDVLLNNAAVASMNHSMLTPLSSFDKMFSTNVTGTFLFCREVAKVMSKQGNGRIVNFSTIGIPLRQEGDAIYIASKAAVEMFTRILAKELASFGITVNAVGPNALKTDLTSRIPEDKMKALLGKFAIKEFSTFEDVINVIDFFLSEKSGKITGQIIYLGGLS
jgi:3-oxoacyl-[acyl-carrier protein] reductase